MSRALKAIAVIAMIAPVIYHYAARPTARRGDDRTVVRYMAWGYPSHLATERDLIDLFESMPENKDIRVDLTIAPMRSYFDKLQMMMASGTGPDVFRIFPRLFVPFIKRDFLMELDGFMDSDPEWKPEEFFEMARVQAIYEGQRYAVVVIFGTNLIYYNKTAFDEAGLDDPWQMFQRGEWDWEKFRETAVKLTQFDDRGRPIRYGTNFGPSTSGGGSISAVSHISTGFGGRLIELDGSRSTVNSPEVVRAVEWIRDLVWKHRAAPTPAQSAMAVFSFESGKIAMQIDASGESRRMWDAISKFEWDVAPLPVGVDGRTAGYGGHLLVMNSQARERDAAWRFMKFMVSPEAERYMACGLRRCIPTRREVAFSDEYLATDGPPYNTRAFISQLDLPPLPFFHDEKYAEWSEVLAGALDRIFLGGAPAEKALNEAAVKIDDILRREED